jgi:hypothetical protein
MPERYRSRPSVDRNTRPRALTNLGTSPLSNQAVAPLRCGGLVVKSVARILLAVGVGLILRETEGMAAAHKLWDDAGHHLGSLVVAVLMETVRKAASDARPPDQAVRHGPRNV